MYKIILCNKYCNIFSDYFRQNATICNFSKSESWVILSEIEQTIKAKIEAVGTSLKDWDINIYRGILTGYNEAFIIDGKKKDELIAQDSKSAEIIRPLLRGRDIKKYFYDFSNLYLLFIPWHFPLQNDPNIKGASMKAEKEFENQYPAIYKHLLKYKAGLSNRNKAETGVRYEWYALQRWGANYWEDFSRQKIIWKRVGSKLCFSYDNCYKIALDSTCFATGKHIKFLVALLNSNMGHYLIKDSPKTGTGDLLVSVQAVEPLQIPLPSKDLENHVSKIVDRLLNNDIDTKEKVELMDELDEIIYTLYQLNDEEKIFIDSTNDQ